MSDPVQIKRALVSVSDKTGLVDFARRLVAQGIQVISTGGTARVLADAGVDVTPVDQITGHPEMLDGRVKTLHPRIHGGLLALRDHPEHLRAMDAHGIEPIDLVCINLYPFEDTISRSGVTDDEAIEQIDIGGPSMIRSGAKNHRFVVVVTDPSQYDRVADEIDTHHGSTRLPLRAGLAAAAFGRTACYDAAIADWMARRDSGSSTGPGLFPDPWIVRLDRVAHLRYGENPHQAAALYATAGDPQASVVTAKQLHGKELSYNNINDAAAALELVKELARPAAAVIKHTNPCGLAVADRLDQAFDRAYAGDPLAAFGGIVALNRAVDAQTAGLMTAPAVSGAAKFLEVVVAPEYDAQALELLRGRWKNVRLLAVGDLTASGVRDPVEFRSVVGGVLAQQPDAVAMTPDGWRHVAGPRPDDQTLRTLHVAWCAVKHVKSNAIVLARDEAVVGVGAGQMDRVQSCRIAVGKANARDAQRSQGAVASSDAFFPFRDGPDVLIAAGIRAIVQPGGSKRDDDTVAACNEAGVSLLFTGRRHFRH